MSSGSLDFWWKCQSEDGCDREVPLPATECCLHGGPDGPWRQTAATGETIYGFAAGDTESPLSDDAA